MQRETGAEKERFRDREIHRGGEAEIEKQRQIRAEDETLESVRSKDRTERCGDAEKSIDRGSEKKDPDTERCRDTDCRNIEGKSRDRGVLRQNGVQWCIVTEKAETLRSKREESRNRNAETNTWRWRVAEAEMKRPETQGGRGGRKRQIQICRGAML